MQVSLEIPKSTAGFIVLRHNNARIDRFENGKMIMEYSVVNAVVAKSVEQVTL